jgi:anti-sigma-K factor RskA
MSPDVHALTGAYVLDAVNDLERAEFERHLAECAACAQEVRELRETAARLGHAAAAAPPPWLKSRVLANISEARQLPVEVWPGAGRRPPSRWALRLTSVAAAVLLVVSVALGVLFVRERQAADENAALLAVLRAGDAKAFIGDGGERGVATIVASRSQNRAVLFAGALPALPPDKVYQAWVLHRDQSQPDGVLRLPAGLVQGDVLEVTGIQDADFLALTIEPPGGSPQPTLPPVFRAPIPA